MRIGEMKDQSVLDNNAAIYAKADDRSAMQKFKDLKGKEKWDFFRDYYLLKLLAIVGGVVLLAMLLKTWLTPRPEVVASVAIIDNPIASEIIEGMKTKLSEVLVGDDEKKTVMFDTNFYFSNGDYNTRMRFMAYVSAREIDFLLIPGNEYAAYLNSSTFLNLRTVLNEEELAKYGEYGRIDIPYDADSPEPEYGPEGMYSIDVTDGVARLAGGTPRNKYYLACIVNSEHPENYAEVLKLFFEE